VQWDKLWSRKESSKAKRLIWRRSNTRWWCINWKLKQPLGGTNCSITLINFHAWPSKLIRKRLQISLGTREKPLSTTYACWTVLETWLTVPLVSRCQPNSLWLTPKTPETSLNSSLKNHLTAPCISTWIWPISFLPSLLAKLLSSLILRLFSNTLIWQPTWTKPRELRAKK
jgi:hypothetical protein